MNIKKSVFIVFILLFMISIVQATKIDILTTKETFSSEESISLKVSLLNEENNPISDEVLIILEDSEKINRIEKTIPSNKFIDVDLQEKVVGGYWSIKAYYKEAESTTIFNIEAKEKAEFTLIDDVLIIKNTGNTEYIKTIQIIIGDNIELKNLKIGIDEEVRYKLIAPDGNYEIKIIVDDKTVISRGDVSLTGTGKVIGSLDEDASQRSGITGGISPDEKNDIAMIGYMKKSTLTYVFILVVFAVTILIAIQRSRMKKKE